MTPNTPKPGETRAQRAHELSVEWMNAVEDHAKPAKPTIAELVVGLMQWNSELAARIEELEALTRDP